ncbi:reverse transcriptase [Gossypium australe]|uniref:Reverse transcriptase n=1 Tax=Gossypium australe TaxID=47621 RepID=A0A5B6V106_9ROSI|nr:reverse transcriptase [Gossypium australe]
MMDSNGNIYENNEDLLSLATSYFDSLFSSNGIENADTILKGVMPCITPSMNDELTRAFSYEEVSNPSSMTQFRPISLCNILYKIAAKMLVNIFLSVLYYCIDKAQSDFVPRRLISNNILAAYEILHSMTKKRLGK